MKKSSLLERVIDKANQLCVEDGKRKVDSNYFFSALLIVLEEVGEEEIFSAEADTVSSILFNKVNSEYTAATVRNGLKDLAENPIMSVIYNKYVMLSEKKARSEDKEELTVDFVLEEILKEPSTFIEKYMLKAGDKIETTTDDGIFSTSKDDKKEGEDKPRDDSLGGEDFFKTDTATEMTKTKSKKKEKEEEERNLFFAMIRRIKHAQTKLLSTVRGQDYAVNSIISGCFQAEILSSMQKDNPKPKATFLFAGPPGVGKTFLAEQTAEVLGLPFKRFDMSEYSDKEAHFEFAGSNDVYKGSEPGLVTSFVSANPKSILLFDEIEKAHLNIIHLFLQILDAGRLRDNKTEEVVSFKNTIIIFTTNIGKKLYEGSDSTNLSTLPRKQILNAISTEISPLTNAPAFPPAICSRFASGNVIMFNHLEAQHLLEISKREFDKFSAGFKKDMGIKVDIENNVLYSLLYSEGANVDARTVRGKTSNFFSQECFELFRHLTASEKNIDFNNLKNINFKVALPEADDMKALFEEISNPQVLVFAEGEIIDECKGLFGDITTHYTDDIDTAKELLFNNDISIVLCDVTCGLKDAKRAVLDMEDIESKGTDFFTYVAENTSKPLYVLEKKENDINQEEMLSFMRSGARGVIYLHGDKKYKVANEIIEKCNTSMQQEKLNSLARANKILSFNTSQMISEDQTEATITLFDFKLKVSPDVDDMKSLLSDVSKPTTKFSDVIGAEDAIEELKYFTAYLKNPTEYMRKGVRAPKGILLYGPPGTGKTLLAKAMAGESDVTYMAVDGNDFLKGNGPEKVHEVFRVARKYAPAVLFIDEIDAVAKNRETALGEATGSILTAFLTEMDGFRTQPQKPVFVLAATNYSVDPRYGRSIDPALLRRFDRKIMVDLPNKNERLIFIERKLSKYKNIQVSKEQRENLAIRSANMSLADIDSAIELALRNCIKNNECIVDDAGLEEAFESYNNGEIKKWSPSELESTARHEVGHALICWLNGETPSFLTIVARGSHGGYMQHDDREEKHTYSRDDMLDLIRVSLAGRAAEMVYYGEKGITTGASSDLANATRLAYNMICAYGMDEEMGLSVVDLDKVDSDTFFRIKSRVDQILLNECQKAQDLINLHKVAFDEMVTVLLEKNQLKGNEIDEIFSKHINKN